MSTNYSTLAALAEEGVTAIQVIFSSQEEYRSAEWKLKRYTYKTLLKDLKKDDLVIVQCGGPSASFNYAVAKVVATDEDFEYNSNTKYKWAVQKLDTDFIDSLLKAEEKLIKEVKAIQKSNNRAELKKALGISGMLRLSLSDDAKELGKL